MPGIAEDSIADFRERLARFRPQYVRHWDEWLATAAEERAAALKRTLARWQACRGNTLRPVDYIQTLLDEAEPHVQALADFELRQESSFDSQSRGAIAALWAIFEGLSYARPRPDRQKAAPRGGAAGAVGISKAALLVTDGRVGPAFDSQVCKKLGVKLIVTADEWIAAMRLASRDIARFEWKNRTTLQEAAALRGIHSGRIYDMALGPG
jgi:hypothetical protein